MATPDEQIRVSGRVKRLLDRHRSGEESYNDVLERLLSERSDGNFDAGFGLLSDEQAERIREERWRAKADRNDRMRRLGEDA
jgi:predicted CopG family antitoxin